MSNRPHPPRYRKHLRLRGYDYRENGYYFVTVCTKDRKPYFVSERAKSILQEKIDQIPRFFPGVTIDQAVVMPNHVHVILLFQSSSKSLGQVIQAFKSWVTRGWGVGQSVWHPIIMNTSFETKWTSIKFVSTLSIIPLSTRLIATSFIHCRGSG